MTLSPHGATASLADGLGITGPHKGGWNVGRDAAGLPDCLWWRGDAWCVVHAASGLSLWYCSDADEAVRVRAALLPLTDWMRPVEDIRAAVTSDMINNAIREATT